MGSYSFLDVGAAIRGPNVNVSIGADAGSTDEGISIEPTADQSSMVIGAGGNGQHNLHGDQSGTITVTLLKTSPTNAVLMDAFNFQKTSAAYHGQNVITVRNVVSGDGHDAVKCAFAKKPSVKYGKDGEALVWVFHCIKIATVLGRGGPTF